MKSKVIITALAALFSWQLQATNPVAPDSSNSSEIRNQIVQLLQNTDICKEKRMVEEVKICFAIDTDGEVQVHRVITGNQQLEEQVALKLNDAQLSVKPPKEEQFYWITVKFQVV